MEGSAKTGGAAESGVETSDARLLLGLGLEEIRQGRYEEAAEWLFNATLEAPSSGPSKMLLSTSLVAIGEYAYAASYLRVAFDEEPGLAAVPFDLRGLYRKSLDLKTQIGLLARRAELEPEPDHLLLLGFLRLATGDLDGALADLDGLRMTGDTADSALAVRLISAALARWNLPAPEGLLDPPLESPPARAISRAWQSFLARPDPLDVMALAF
jgi:tetratricopeptide (TPR) repeat protein